MYKLKFLVGFMLGGILLSACGSQKESFTEGNGIVGIQSTSANCRTYTDGTVSGVEFTSPTSAITLYKSGTRRQEVTFYVSSYGGSGGIAPTVTSIYWSSVPNGIVSESIFYIARTPLR
jgi:hypothetical protein